MLKIYNEKLNPIIINLQVIKCFKIQKIKFLISFSLFQKSLIFLNNFL